MDKVVAREESERWRMASGWRNAGIEPLHCSKMGEGALMAREGYTCRSSSSEFTLGEKRVGRGSKNASWRRLEELSGGDAERGENGREKAV